MRREDPQVRIRLPPAEKAWVEREAAKNMRTQSAEIALAIRAKMEAGSKASETSPAAIASHAA